MICRGVKPPVRINASKGLSFNAPSRACGIPTAAPKIITRNCASEPRPKISRNQDVFVSSQYAQVSKYVGVGIKFRVEITMDFETDNEYSSIRLTRFTDLLKRELAIMGFEKGWVSGEMSCTVPDTALTPHSEVV